MDGACLRRLFAPGGGMSDYEAFEALVDAFSVVEGVDPPGAGRGFGAAALRVDGRIFAMCPRGQLVVKLPASRVAALIAEGAGSAFDAGKGRPMREWLTVGEDTPSVWLSLSREAYEFVRARGR